MNISNWIWLISTVVAIVLGIITWKLDDKEKAIVGLLGLVTVSFGATFGLYFEVKEIRQDISSVLARTVPTLRSPTWNSVVQDIAQYDRENSETPLIATLNEPLREIISRSIGEAKEGYIKVSDKNEVVVVTDRLLGKARQTVQATSYIDPKEWWQSTFAQTYAAQLRSTMKHVASFQRIFIVDSTREAEVLKPVMEEQLRDGLDVKYACASTVPSDDREDFIVVDSSVAGQLVLNEKRQFKEAIFYSTEVRAADFARIFANLWIAARKPADIERFPCTTSQ